jgi:hypothetical protein
LKVLKCGEKEEIMERGKYKNTEGERKRLAARLQTRNFGILYLE